MFAKVVKFLPLRFVAAVLLVKLTTSRNVKWFKYDGMAFGSLVYYADNILLIGIKRS